METERGLNIRNSKAVLIFDMIITVVIFLWMLKSFGEGEVWKGILFIICFALMAGVLFFRFRRKR